MCVSNVASRTLLREYTPAELFLGECYLKGHGGVEIDDAVGTDWIIRAGERKKKTATPEAFYIADDDKMYNFAIAEANYILAQRHYSSKGMEGSDNEAIAVNRLVKVGAGGRGGRSGAPLVARALG